MATISEKKKRTGKTVSNKKRDPYQQFVVEPAKRLIALLKRIDKKTTSH